MWLWHKWLSVGRGIEQTILERGMLTFKQRFSRKISQRLNSNFGRRHDACTSIIHTRKPTYCVSAKKTLKMFNWSRAVEKVEKLVCSLSTLQRWGQILDSCIIYLQRGFNLRKVAGRSCNGPMADIALFRRR